MDDQGQDAEIELNDADEQHLRRRGERARERAEIRAEHRRAEQKLRAKDHEAHDMLLRQTLGGAGVDVDELLSTIDRRHAIQRKRAEGVLKDHREKEVAFAKREMRERKRNEIAYRRTFKDDLDRLQGNPVLKILLAAASSSEVLASPGPERPEDPGAPVWWYSDDMHVDLGLMSGRPYHPFTFWPYINIDDRFDRNQYLVELEQTITFYHPPLAAGRGNFEVHAVQVNLAGSGYHQSTDLRAACPFFLDSRGWYGSGGISMDLVLHQWVESPRGGSDSLSANVLDDVELYVGRYGAAEAFTIDLRSTRYGRHFLLAGPDHGGSNILATFVLRTFAQTSDEDPAVSIMDLRPDAGGLELECIELVGEYLD